MTDQELQQLVETISLASFHRPFVHQAKFNGRLKTTGGRFHLKDYHLDFNPTMFAQYPEAIPGIIKHELVHYHLYQQGLGHTHRDAAFKQLLQQVGGLRYAPTMPTKTRPYHYQCQNCGQDYWRKRRMNVARYRCSRCYGQLKAV
ncbi:SprT family protein [Lacticaseibacillus saniviri]|uniref:SprT-like domain-containing protein n=1 Tax=Lacticaseibacillus saniviri JCM 17471 = DSM 24301 TaxID=1293598 RepID=A0A0R2MQV5_9LACO|nr:SprT family protein [Lacticaseibacillus saniviri]KRO16017.1 hypothetical protein IV56_GL002016 [Lacticaseibacillus saniviri JCM 17471 = DSM 24301]MCG4282839.1 SprT family protein [Lacticaseibacillus saniviri]